MKLGDVLDSHPFARGPLPIAILRSWFTLDSAPSYHMRIGGFGPLFLFALPFGLAGLVRTWRTGLWLAAVAVFAHPYVTWARFTVAFVALVFALTAPYLGRIPAGARSFLMVVAAAIGMYQIAYAWPGLIAEAQGGPPLRAYFSMSKEERALAIGVEVTEPFGPYIDIRKRVGDGETYAIDGGDLMCLAWDEDFRYRVLLAPNGFAVADVEAFFAREKVRVFMAGDGRPTDLWVREHPDRVKMLLRSSLEPYAIYELLPGR